VSTPRPQKTPRPLVLCILDGFGERDGREANAIRLARAPNLAGIVEKFPRTLLSASGKDVGLPDGQMGNSEVGHLNFGAGRVAQMDLARIDVAVAERTLGLNRVIGDVLFETKHRSESSREDDPHPPCRLHLMGLLSDGGVHSSIEHLEALIILAAENDVKVVLHAFLDGRDVAPKSALKYVERIERLFERTHNGIFGTVGGRYWGMDRDKRWDRVYRHLETIVFAEGVREHTAGDAVVAAYDRGETDEFVEPTPIGEYHGIVGRHSAYFDEPGSQWKWRGDEIGLCFNFRPDRMRQLCAMLTHTNLPPEVSSQFTRANCPVIPFEPGTLSSLTEYDPTLKLPVAFPKDAVAESFGEIVARAGKKQFRCAETEKYAHVTYFFNGGREEPFDGEDRKLIPSPRDVATYDLKPEMSAAAVTSAVVEAIESDRYDVVVMNYANPDMVGHTGVLDAATRAVEEVDKGLGALRDAVLARGGALLITADHGNCETMVDVDGGPHTAHTTNPVPLYYVTESDPGVALRDGGRLADVAPTMLELLGLPQPEIMSGVSLRISGPRGGAGTPASS
jgi:2,3-bisphosphoglycerate-independent phosphoglycerate mutase